MTENQILSDLAALNPVSDEPDYDEDAERGLMALLHAVKAEAPLPARGRSIPRRRLARLPGWGAVISIAAAVAIALVVATGGMGERHELARKPAAPRGPAY